jgi:hypothetical protein
MDFITSLLEAQGFNVVLVIVNTYSKLAYMVPLRGGKLLCKCGARSREQGAGISYLNFLKF